MRTGDRIMSVPIRKSTFLGTREQEQERGKAALLSNQKGRQAQEEVLFSEGKFLCSFRVCIRGFHNVLKEKPSYLLDLLGWSSTSYHFSDDLAHGL
jgi:hypothetical protein